MVPTETITHERLLRWQRRLSQEHATPTLLVGIGHDHKSGQLVVCTCEEVTDDQIRAMLLFALEQLGH